MPTTYPDRPHRHLYKQHDHSDGYSFDSGQFILPLAQSEPTDPNELAAFVPFVTVRAHADIAYRTAEFETVKDGAPPQAIPPQSQGPFVFLEGEMTIMAPKLQTNGFNETWQVSGSHTYAVAGAASLVIQNGLVMQSMPIPTPKQKFLTQTYGGGQGPADLVISTSGADVKACYTEAQQVSFVGNAYTYWGTTLYPGNFFNESLLVGNTLFVGQ